MPGMGPPPKPADQRARRNATVAMIRLPADGRKGRAPAWPLDADIGIDAELFEAKRNLLDIRDELKWATTARDRSALRRKQDRLNKKVAELEAKKKFTTAAEKKIWAALWKTPQSTQWQKRGWFREVALYARHQAKAESGSLDDSKEARQREDRLGLNDLAMLRLRWEIVSAAEAAPGPQRRSKRNSSKYRNLRVVS